MKKTFLTVCTMCFAALMLTSCEWFNGHPWTPGGGGDDTPGGGGDDIVDFRLSNVVPDDIRDKMEDYMPIYNGVNPPNIDGVYLSDPMQTVYDGFGLWSPGSVVAAPMHMKFFDQDGDNMIRYRGWENGELSDQSDRVYISGKDQNFTAFFNSEAETLGVKVKMAVLISGTKTNSGISNLYYGVVALSKSQENESLMPDGTFRVFKDGDGNSPNASWPGGVRAAGEQFIKSILDTEFPE